jgi:elongator complex protein 6
MSTRNRTPPLLEPYLRLPSEGSQLLLTGVLDSTPNWLVTRLLRSAYTSPTETESPEEQDVTVVLVSWLRDYEFWKSEARRGAGIDLARLAQQDKFIFVDGLTQLFPVGTSTSTSTSNTAAAPVAPQTAQRSLPVRNTPAFPLPNRGGPLPSRAPIPSRGPPPPTPSQPTAPAQQAQPQPQTQQQPSKTTYLTSASTSSTHSTLTSTISTLQSAHPTRKIHLILDSPTLLLSTTSNPSALALSSLLLSLRSLVTTTTLIVQADAPFLSAALPDSNYNPTPLEAAHAAFVVQQAHVSKWVLSLRPLDTGKARDVSGVIRVSRGGAWDDDDEEVEEKEQAKELEALYFVQNDGGVRVFERGEASVG